MLMSEIEKMYKIAKVKPSHYSCAACKYDMSGECPKKCPDNVAIYPLFTKEKQLELIKFFVKNYEGVDISKNINRFNFLVDNATFSGCRYNAKTFEDGLAGIINKLWADMTDEEKQQVKEILK